MNNNPEEVFNQLEPFSVEFLKNKKETYQLALDCVEWFKTKSKLSEVELENVAEFMWQCHPYVRIKMWGAASYNIRILFQVHPLILDIIIWTGTSAAPLNNKEMRQTYLKNFLKTKQEVESSNPGWKALFDNPNELLITKELMESSPQKDLPVKLREHGFID